MLNQGQSEGGADAKEPFRPSGRQIFGGVVAIVLLVFIAVNNEQTSVSFVFFEATLPLWVVLAGTALLGVGIGMMIGTRRTKAKLARKG
jgi:uncharacterized integral membrane protein